MKRVTWSDLALLAILLTAVGAALFILGGATGAESIATAGAVMMLPATIVFAVILVAVVAGYALAGLVTALAALASALRRCRPR